MYILICSSVTNKGYTQWFAFNDQVLKRTTDSRRNYALNSNVSERRREGNTKVIWCSFFSLRACSMCLLLFLRNMLPVCFSFSGPAHILCLNVASGWNKERCMPEFGIKITVTESLPFCLYLLSIACIRIIFNVAFRNFSFFRNWALTPFSFHVFFANLFSYNFASFSFTDDVLCYIRYKYIRSKLI
jgi:hypothetical protein